MIVLGIVAEMSHRVALVGIQNDNEKRILKVTIYLLLSIYLYNRIINNDVRTTDINQQLTYLIREDINDLIFINI